MDTTPGNKFSSKWNSTKLIENSKVCDIYDINVTFYDINVKYMTKLNEYLNQLVKYKLNKSDVNWYIVDICIFDI